MAGAGVETESVFLWPEPESMCLLLIIIIADCFFTKHVTT